MVDLLLINLPSAFSSYAGTRINAAAQNYPLLSFAYLAAVARKEGFKVKILDLGIEMNPYRLLHKKLDEYSPRFVGLTATTPLFFEAAVLSRIIKDHLGDRTKLIIGGPHATALPVETLRDSHFEILVYGEGELTLVDILKDKPLKEIAGIYYKEGGQILNTQPRLPTHDLDWLPFPALDLFDIKRYKCPRVLNRVSPMCNYMSSRGCVFGCTFCNKNIFGRRFRARSVELAVDEIEYMLNCGIREVRILDDMFTTDMERAKKICEMIIQRNLKFPWTLSAGLRVDSMDLEFLTLAKRAGLYQVSIGFESGDQASLDSICKNIKVEQSYNAMKLVRKAGLESIGFFMFGLPADSEESLKKTTKLALDLVPDYAKVTITVPFPGTELYSQYESQGLIKSRDWRLYNLHRAGDIYTHPNLSHEILEDYYQKFYFKFYLNPRYLLRRLWLSLKNKTLFLDIYFGLQTFFPKLFKAKNIFSSTEDE